jgi:hypothetical protein
MTNLALAAMSLTKPNTSRTMSHSIASSEGISTKRHVRPRITPQEVARPSHPRPPAT